jgi:hypothetical protein
MKDSISDEAAKTFAASFYRAIGFGHSVHQAFQQARTALLLESIDEDNIPILLVHKGVDPNKIILVKPDTLS